MGIEKPTMSTLKLSQLSIIRILILVVLSTVTVNKYKCFVFYSPLYTYIYIRCDIELNTV